MNFFDILQDILLKKSGGTLHEDMEFNKIFSPFMLVRYLSMQDSLVPYSVIFNKYQMTLSSEELYKFAYRIIPKQSNGYIKYISKKGKK